MPHALPFASWESFYVILGSSAAALTGLQFVVVVLGAEQQVVSGLTLRAFATPTIVHFCAALLISAILSAPWTAASGAAICLGVCGVLGLLYVLGVLRDAKNQSDYVPVFEDWLWHFILPAIAYVTLLIAAITLHDATSPASFAVAASTVLLLMIGIHNAWDAVTYIALERRMPDGLTTEPQKPKPRNVG